MILSGRIAFNYTFKSFPKMLRDEQLIYQNDTGTDTDDDDDDDYYYHLLGEGSTDDSEDTAWLGGLYKREPWRKVSS
jgi:hypothetical protein